MLKGMGINSIIKLTLAITIASAIIGISTIGSLGDAITDAFDSARDSTDQTVEVDNSRTMADLSLFVQHKGVNRGCELIEGVNEGELEPNYPDDLGSWNGGYEGLEGTILTSRPDCFGADASMFLQLDFEAGVNPEDAGVDDNYMPGLQSRETFRVTEDFVVDGVIERSDDYVGYGAVEDESATYLEAQLRSSFQGHRNQIDQEVFTDRWYICNDAADFDLIPIEASVTGTVGNLVTNDVYVTCFVYEGLGLSETDTMNPILIYEGGDISERTNFVQDYDDEPRPSEDGDAGFLHQIQFCEGDQGYVQANRGEIGTGGDGHSDEEPLIPIIVVEETEEDNCGGPRGLEDYYYDTSDEQLFIEGSGASLPRTDQFKLRNDITGNIDNYSQNDKCSVYYRETDVLLAEADNVGEEFEDAAEQIIGTIQDEAPSEKLMDAFEKYAEHRFETDLGPDLKHHVVEMLRDNIEFGTGETVKHFDPGKEISATEDGLKDSDDYEHRSVGNEFEPGEIYKVEFDDDGLPSDVIDEVENILNDIGDAVSELPFVDVGEQDIPTSLEIPPKTLDLTIDVRAVIMDGLEDNGLNGDRFIDRADIFHDDYSGNLRLSDFNFGFDEMHGDLKCAADDEGHAEWHLCHERHEDKSIEVDGEEVTCDPESGEWEEVS